MTDTYTKSSKNKSFRISTKYIVLIIIFVLSVTIHITTRLSTKLSDFLNFGISNIIRGTLAKITSVLPFSLGETILIIVPIIMVILIISVIFNLFSDRVFSKISFKLTTIAVALYALFALSLSPAYGTSTADNLFNVNCKALTKDELKEAAAILVQNINDLADEVDYYYGSFSKMNHSLDELSSKLVNAYDKLESKYSFINNFGSRLKPIALSEPMTYTHISGVYSYYTGESNINTNFPDYTIPFTSAHEMAHQRGFARENEANFVAYLVCCESEDAYIRYSGFLNMFEYITNSLYALSPKDYYDLFYSLDIKVRCEMAEYGKFFEKYRDSTASKVSGTINDNYLKSQGIEDGEKSYGMVVDLAASYILENTPKEVSD